MNNSIAIITDIYGLTPAVIDWKNQLEQHYQQVHVLSPYQQFQFEQTALQDEQAIYQHFISHCGHDAFKDKVKMLLSANDFDYIVAFSAGASATWRVLAESTFSVKQFVGIYPSQIRNHLSISPKCSTSLIFPISEPHFSVDDVIKTLSAKKQVTCIKTPWFHGFFNQYSSKFNAQAHQLLSAAILTGNNALEPKKINQLISDFVT